MKHALSLLSILSISLSLQAATTDYDALLKDALSNSALEGNTAKQDLWQKQVIESAKPVIFQINTQSFRKNSDYRHVCNVFSLLSETYSGATFFKASLNSLPGNVISSLPANFASLSNPQFIGVKNGVVQSINIDFEKLRVTLAKSKEIVENFLANKDPYAQWRSK